MRIWRRRKRYAATVITLLTLVFAGIGTVLGILSTSVLRPLPFARPGELFQSFAVYNGLADLWSFDELERTSRYVGEVAQLTAMAPMQRQDVSIRGTPVGANVVTTTPNFFQVLGISTGVPSVVPGSAIISSRLLNRLGLSASQIIGSSVVVGGKSLTVVAVIDRSRAYPADGEIWFSDVLPGRAWLGIMRTRRDMPTDVVADRVSRAFQLQQTGSGYVRVQMRSLPDYARPAVAGAQRMLLAGIAMFSLIAILNYGLLGIGEARRRAQEFAVRVAVGGTRAQVMRGLLLDQLSLVVMALCLSLAGLIAVASRAYDPGELVQALIHQSAAIWLALACAFALLLFAAALPMRVSSNTPEMDILRRVNARASRFEKVWNRGFVSLQFGATSFLLVVAGLVLLGLRRDRKAAYGFDASNAIIASMSFSEARQEPRKATLALREFDEQLRRAFPGRATIWASGYRSMSGGQYRFAIDSGEASTRIGGFPWMSQDVASNFFDVMGIPIIAGRAFTDADDESAAPAIILTARAAKSLWGSSNVIGRKVRFGEDDGTWRTVIGVAADAFPISPSAFMQQSRGPNWSNNYAYRSLAQTFPRHGFKFENGAVVGFHTGFSVIVREAAVTTHSPTLQALLNRVAPAEKFRTIAMLDRYLDRTGEVERGAATMRLLFIFGACGLALGIIGALILIDDVVRSRTTEFGIRRALGAPSVSLVSLASRETLVAGVGGVIVGALVGARFGPVVSVWLKGTLPARFLPPAPLNWPLIAATVGVLILVLALGTVLRAMRAARLDPAVALRES